MIVSIQNGMAEVVRKNEVNAAPDALQKGDGIGMSGVFVGWPSHPGHTRLSGSARVIGTAQRPVLRHSSAQSGPVSWRARSRAAEFAIALRAFQARTFADRRYAVASRL